MANLINVRVEEFRKVAAYMGEDRIGRITVNGESLYRVFSESPQACRIITPLIFSCSNPRPANCSNLAVSKRAAESKRGIGQAVAALRVKTLR